MKKKFTFRFPLWAKTLLVLFLSFTTISVISIVYSSNNLRNITRSQYIDNSIKLADTLGVYLDVNELKTVRDAVDAIYKDPTIEKVDNSYWGEPEWVEYLNHFESTITAMPEFQSILSDIETFHAANPNVKYTYVSYADFTNKRMIYLVDDSDPGTPATDTEPRDYGERCLPGSFDLFTEQDYTIFDHLEEGFTPEITNYEQYEYLVSVGRPVFDSDIHDIDHCVCFSLIELSMDKIVAEENRITRDLTIILASIGTATLLISYILVLFLIIRPIRKLTKVANEYTNKGDDTLDKFAKVRIRTRDEIEDLSNSMKKMEGDLNKYIQDLLGAEKKADELKYLADKDALTGLNNKRAYFSTEERLNEEIKKGTAEFAVTMIDLNDLKVTNDTLGHEKGDELIIALANTIKKIFIHSEMYRIGGDEFVVISEDGDLAKINELKETFESTISNSVNGRRKDDLPISAAIGVAIFDSKSDNNVEDTFKRADAKMYQNKKAMKQN